MKRVSLVFACAFVVGLAVAKWPWAMFALALVLALLAMCFGTKGRAM